ncbi:MAG: death-on-curing family protein [Acidobacteria bacterium]|nr:death-on-curing family protein [Acidobacteriota bacterium]
MVVYLSLAQVTDLQRRQLVRYGGLGGLRDRGALEAAVARPQMTFGGEDLYPDAAAVVFLLANGVELTASAGALAEITLATARGELSAEALAIWFRQRSRAAGV